MDGLKDGWADSRRQVVQSSGRAWQVGLIASALALVFVAALLVKHQGDAMQLVHIGTAWRYHVPYPQGTNGYDGQYSYYIARYGLAGAEYMDSAAWRFMRILYPLLMVVLSVGQPGLMPWMMLAINVVAVGVAAGCMAWLLDRWGAPPLFALLFPLWIGVLVSLALDLSELLMFALSLGGIAAYYSRRVPLSIGLFALAGLTKEVGVIFAGALALHALLAERRWWTAALLAVLPTAVYLAWFVVVWQFFGVLPVEHGGSHMIPLFLGLLPVRTLYPVRFWFALLVLGLPFLALAGLLVRQLFTERRLSVSGAVLAVSLVFISSLPQATWIEPIGVMRTGAPLILAGLLFLGQHHPRLLRYAAAFEGVLLLLLIYLLPTL